MTEQKPKKEPNWFVKERFGWMDLLMIFIVIQIIDWILSHLSWT